MEIIKENTRYLVGTNLKDTGMVAITTSKIIGENVDIAIWSIKNGQLINFGTKCIYELEELFLKDGYKIDNI
jgi:hypothetical protein